MATRSNSVKGNLIFLCCAIVFFTIVLFVFNLILIVGAPFPKSTVISISVDTFLASAIVLLSCFTYSYIKKTLISPLFKLSMTMEAVKAGNEAYIINNFPQNEIGEMAVTFGQVAANLQQTQQKLHNQTSELYDKNWELQEANTELEASYGQLQAIIEQLNEAEQKYHSLVRNIPEMVCVIENTGMISFVNHVSYGLLGYDKCDLIGKSFSQFISPHSEAISVEEIQAKLDSENTYALELSFIKKNGQAIIAEVKFTNYVFNGMSMGLQAIIRDVTERKQLEKAILQSNKELSILNSVSKSLTSTLDLDQLCNAIVSEITQTLGCPACILYLVDKDTSVMSAKASSGEFYSHGANQSMAAPESLIRKDMEKLLDKYAVFNGEEPDAHWVINKAKNDWASAKEIPELLSVPVTIKDKKLGVIVVGFSSAIEEHEITLIASIANNAAVAIDNALLYETSKKYFIKTVDALIATVEAKDDYTEGHSQRVSMYAVDIAEKLNLSKEQIEDIKVAGMLHDIGKIGISDAILLKPEGLTADEYEIIKQHPLISKKILYPVGFSERTMKAIAYHHERFDGKGYPYGLAGSNITLEAQIIAVADAYDAMTSSRSYRKSMSAPAALQELSLNKATQFNPKVVDAFLEVAKHYGE